MQNRVIWALSLFFAFSNILGEAQTIQVLKNRAKSPLGIQLNSNETAAAEQGTIQLSSEREILYTPSDSFTGEDRIRIADNNETRSITVDVRSHPNFVFILTDDQSWTGLSTPTDRNHSHSASDYHQTPKIDQLAQSGMRFSRGYSPAPNCSTTRYANLTGKTCARLHFTDIVGRGHTLPPEGTYRLIPISKEIRDIQENERTLPELLKSIPDTRYRTAHLGKWHLDGGGPEKHGFDFSDGNTGNGEGNEGNPVNDDPKRAYSITERANRFISDSLKTGDPFFCQVSHYAVHAVIQHRSDTLDKLAHLTLGNNHSSSAYAAMVADLDAAVGILLNHLDALGLRQSTYVIYQADNGAPQFMSNAYPLRRYKPEIWEGGIRVPTFFRGPGIPENSQCDQPMMGIDLLPTIWGLAGGHANQLPSDLDGTSISHWLFGDTNQVIQRPGELVVHSPHYVVSEDLAKNQRPSSALHAGPWKLVAWYETGDVHLFNLEEDLSESIDQSKEHPQIKLQLWKRLRDYLAKVEAQLPKLDPVHEMNTGKGDDADADGLPDHWEFRHLLTHSLGPEDDPDEDGISNKIEHIRGTDPLLAQR